MDSCEMSTLGLRPRFDISTSEHICHTRHHASFVYCLTSLCVFVRLQSVMMSNSSLMTWNSFNASLTVDDLVELIDGELRSIPSYTATVIAALVLIANSGTLLALTGATFNANLRLVLSLTLADILVALSVLVTFNVQLPPVVDSELATCVQLCLQGLQMTAHIVSLLSLLALAVDHYYAICRPLQYSFTMRRRPVIAAILLAWLLSTTLGFSDLFFPNGDCTFVLTSASYCQRAWCSSYEPQYVMLALAALVLAIIAVFYVLIYRTVCRYRAGVVSHSCGHRVLRRNLRAVYTTLAILGVFLACWLPYSLFVTIVSALMYLDQDGHHTVRLFQVHRRYYLYLYDLLLLNGLADPFIYALRMRAVRRGYRRAVARLPPTSRQPASRSRDYTTSKGTGGSTRAVTQKQSSTVRCEVGKSSMLDVVELRPLQGNKCAHNDGHVTITADVNVASV